MNATWTRSARVAIPVFGLLALLATPAAQADPPVPLVSAPVSLSSTGSETLSAAESAVQSFVGSPAAGDPVDGKLPATNDAPAAPALGTTTVEPSPSPNSNSGNNANSTPAATVAKEAAPASPPDRAPPGNVRGLHAEAGNRAVTLRWSLPPDADFNHVVISRAPQTAGPAETSVYKGPAKRFVDRRLTNGVAYRYLIVSYDRAGNRSAGVAVVAAPRALMLLHPSNGARVKVPPLLRWVWIPGATFYNVQLFRGPMRIKVMTAWPAANRLQLRSRWIYARRSRRLVPGIYRWVVWPGFGRQIAKRYGPLLGEGAFTVVARKNVVTAPSPRTPAVPALKPDPSPVQRRRAPARKPASAAKPVLVRAPSRPSNRTPVRTVSRPAEPVLGRTLAYARRAAQPSASRRPSGLGKKKQQAVPSFAPLSAPSGIEHSLAQRRWLVVAILGTGFVFLSAVGSRRLFERPARTAPSGSTLREEAPPGPGRRCLVPGCHHSDHLPARRRSGARRSS